MTSKEEYLKRYLSDAGAEKKKKKKRQEKVKQSRLRIIDEDVDFQSTLPKTAGQTLEDELEDDAPTVADVVDERPQHVQQVEQYRKSSKWKTITHPSEKKKPVAYVAPVVQGKTKSPSSKYNDGSGRLKQHRSPGKRHRHDSSDSDVSIPMQRHDSESPPRQKHGSDQEQRERYNSPVGRQRHDSDSDQSPVRNERHDSDSDQSPVRSKRQDSDSDQSPVRSKRQDSDSDQSPVRRQRQDSDSDQSPVRRQRQDSDSDQSPVRRQRQDSESDQSPVRRQKQDSDSDQSPPRKQKSSEKTLSSSHKHSSTGSRHSQEREHQLVRRKGSHEDDRKRKRRWEPEERPSPNREEKDSRGRATKTLSGATAGLSSAKDMRDEAAKLRQKEDQMFSQVDESLLGKGAGTVFRDKSGKRRNPGEEAKKTKEEEERAAQKAAKYQQWGKGLKQQEDQKQNVADALHEASKPLARYKDDEDLDSMLKDQEREGDPMLAFLKKSKKGSASDKEKPKYKGPAPPPNRFGIGPGYRWDGVNRSNGFERKLFSKQADRKATETLAYKWSTEDM